ncbi:centrosomal protein of 170 kDa-like isoform X2 [Centruroides vittatus]|uniref:centrosomal protein of 170 kDa-like isoform X2 n=1 Tax=Centruroides vittatus TaxID=120091 RepID=UPI00350EC849
MDQCVTKMEDWQLVRKDGEIYHLPFGMSFIGREECDITLQSHSVDKRHAVIFYDSSDKEVRIKDLNSLTGTHVNSVRIPEQSYVKLKHLDCIRFGYGPDLFYIQKIDTKQSTVSPKKEILEPSTVCHNSNTTAAHFEETTKDNIESKHFLIEQDKSRESELYSSIHEADSLEDIKQSVSENSSTSPSLAISEKVPIVDKSLKTKYLEDKGNMYCALEQNLNAQTSQEIESMDDGKEKKLPFEGKQKISQQIKEELPALEMQILQLYNGKNEEGNQKVSNKDSEQANSESSPVAMAFTIAFDSDLTASRKKLGIKDSISQYAPRKTEPERSPIQKLRPGKLNESNSKKALSLDMKDITLSAPDISKKWIQENAKQSLLSQSTESTLWDLASKREHKEKVSSEGKLTIESSPRMTNWSQNWNKKNQLDGIIKSPTKVSSECRIKSPDDGSVLQKEIDDKSETGTYTVETDLNDPAVDEARQKIDEIFGIHKNIEKLQASNLNSEEKEKQHSVANEQSKCLVKPVTPITLISQQGNEISFLEKSHPKTKTEKNARPKRRLPTPPIPKQLDASISDSSVDSSSNNVTRLGHYPLSLIKKEKKHQSSHSNNQDSSCDSYSKQSSGPLQNTTSFYISSDNTSDRRSKFLENVQSQKLQKSLGLTSSTIVPSSHISLDSCDSQTKSNIAQQENCQNGDEDSLDGTTLLHYVPSDTRSEGSPQAKTPQNGSGLWRRIPWNLSNSDLELNRSKSETASVVSDLSTSTEPSSLSSQYSKGKSDSAPPMRLNRAFALRRARLGIESDSATTVVSKKGSKENIKQQSSSNKISSHLNPQQLSRQDGGRFSLRLPRKCTTKSNEKSASKSKDSKRNSAASNKNGHRRIESDPGKANIHWKKMDIINDTVNSDVEAIEAPIISSPYNKLQSFHRSASFNGAEELLFEKDNLNDSSKKLERPNKLVKSSAISKLRKQSGLGTTRALGISPGWQHSSFEEKGSEKLSQGKGSPQQQNSSKKELSALDSLVISAIHQLSIKLRTRARCLLEKEGQKYSEKSDIRLMIEEVLPQVVEKKSNIHNEGNLTRDLSSILKNLKRVEQSLEVLSSLADYDTQIKGEQNQTETQKFFVVDV